MKILCLFLTCFTCFCTYAQSNYYWFDRKFKRTNNSTIARYQARITPPNEPTKVMTIGSGEVFAEGVIVPADTLQFEGVVFYYQTNGHVSDIQVVKNGELQKPIFVNENLKPVTYASHYLLYLADNNTCYTIKTELSVDVKPQKYLYAKGKIANNDINELDSTVTFFNKKGDIIDIKKYDKGKEIPFINTTMGYDKPHDILGIVSYKSEGFQDIDSEMRAFLLKCKLTGADAVIGVHTGTSQIPSTEYSIARSTLIIQGTAIKFK